MVFSSPVFVFIFLPAVFLLNCAAFLLKRKAASVVLRASGETAGRKRPGAFWRFFSGYGITVSNYLLLAASLLFYAWGEPLFVFLLVLVTLLCYVFALLIAFCRKRGRRKTGRLFLILALVSALGLLGFFKYFAFGLRLLGALPFFSSLLPAGGRTFSVTLPLGISFYTFQILSYVIDVYTGKAAASRNFARVLLYVSLFPQLVAGPIVKYADIEAQLTERTPEAETVARGIRRFICGLAKKMLIANTVAVMADGIFSLGADRLTGASAWCGAIAYLFQIYFDFSGYSDMAIGLGAMFGFRFRENFRYPYAAVSVQDFWRRWHISVSSWFKEYLYIPLGGNRKGRLRTGINKVTVFFFTGLWHGANFTFIVWGLWHGLFLLLEAYVPPLFKKKGVGGGTGKGFPARLAAAAGRLAGYIYTMLVVLIGFVIFRADSLSYAFLYLKKMFTAIGPLPQAFAAALSYADGFTVFIFVLAALLSFPVSRGFFRAAERLDERRSRGGEFVAAAEAVAFAGSAVLFCLCILSLASSSYNPFIYFKF